MARLTLKQIQGLVPSEISYLQSLGYEKFSEDGFNFDWRHADPDNDPYGNAGAALERFNPTEMLRQQGIADANDPRFSAATVAALNKQHGTNFTPETYLEYVYGPGVQRVGDYLVLPDGRSADQYTNTPLSYEAPKSLGGQLVKAGILGLAGAGLTGMLPGTESIFSGFGGSAVNAGGLDGALGDVMVNGITPGTSGSGSLLTGGITDAAWGVNQQGGNMGFFDDYLGSDWLNGSGDALMDASFNSATNPIQFNYTSMPVGAENLASMGIESGLPGGLLYGSDTSWLSSLLGKNPLSTITSGVKSLFGDNQTGSDFNLGSLFGGSNPFNSVVNAAPFLAAVNYAQNQDPFNTSNLQSIYDEFNPEANAFEYDQNTALGRNRLTNSLTQRGVMGSSFGNNDITSFNTTRDLGRNALLNQGLTAKSGIASSILDADVKSRALKNDLYGRALSGLGGALSPKSTIFA